MKYSRKILATAALCAPSLVLSYAGSKIDINLMDGKKFGDYGITSITLRAGCGSTPMRHKNTSTEGNINLKSKTYVSYETCNGGSEPSQYELKLMESNGRSHSCGVKQIKKTKKPDNPFGGISNLEKPKPKSIQIQSFNFKNLSDKGYHVKCDWDYGY